MSLNNAKLSSALLSFTSGYIGGEMDESSTFKVADYESGDLKKKMDSYSPTDTTLQDWKNWFLGSKTDQFNSHQSSQSEADYVRFLKKQNTKQSLEAALLISPSLCQASVAGFGPSRFALRCSCCCIRDSSISYALLMA